VKSLLAASISVTEGFSNTGETSAGVRPEGLKELALLLPHANSDNPGEPENQREDRRGENCQKIA
jgi:hypothetical protein